MRVGAFGFYDIFHSPVVVSWMRIASFPGPRPAFRNPGNEEAGEGEHVLGVRICPVSTVSKWLTVSKWWTISRRNDVIIQAAIEAHSERWNRFTQTAIICLGRNSLSRCCQVSSRSTAIALPYTRSIWVFPWESPRKILRVIKCHSGRSRAHLTVSTERVLFQTNKSCLCKSFSPLLWASMAVRVITSFT